MPLDIHKALQRSGITSVSATVIDEPVFKGPAEAGGDRVVSDELETSCAGNTETLSGRFCGEKTRGVLGSICSWTLKRFGIVCDEMFGECTELVELTLDCLELL